MLSRILTKYCDRIHLLSKDDIYWQGVYKAEKRYDGRRYFLLKRRTKLARFCVELHQLFLAIPANVVARENGVAYSEISSV